LVRVGIGLIGGGNLSHADRADIGLDQEAKLRGR
jgi:hypothetical protein